MAVNLQITSMDSGLRDDVRKERVADIRKTLEKDTAGARAKMKEAADDAKKKLPYLTQEAARARALETTDASQRPAMFETLKRTGRPELVTKMREAVAERNIAKAEAIRLEFTSRKTLLRGDGAPDPVTTEFGTLLKDLHDAGAAAQEKDMLAVIAVNDLANHQVLEVVNGRSDPIGRMTAARLAQAALTAE